MTTIVSIDRLRFLWAQRRSQLWIRPLMVCLLSIGGAFAARFTGGIEVGSWAPDISAESIESLLAVMASSMLAVATFAVGSMVSAYAAVGSAATPRAFRVVIADDISKNALSTFIGAFIYSIVALIAMKNGYYDPAGRLTLFAMTIAVFAMVIITFVRWVDRIARLGRVGTTIDSVERAAANAMRHRLEAPTMGAVPAVKGMSSGHAVHAACVGYVQYVDVAALQEWAEDVDGRVTVAAVSGTLATPDRPLVHAQLVRGQLTPDHAESIRSAFQIGSSRLFDNDPRFGLVVLSEIAGRALSPGINDPGTAINVLGAMVRLFDMWSEPSRRATEAPDGEPDRLRFDRVEVPALSTRDLLDDAFTAIGRDGAGTVEVAVRLQKALAAIAAMGHAALSEAAQYHAELALRRSTEAMTEREDIAAVREATMPIVRRRAVPG